MIKIYSNITLSIFIFTNFFSINIAKADNEQVNKKLFIVTAYYSPLPNQSIYLKGSYEEDIKLNGTGLNGASGKKVFPGMIAAPKTYPFGTKIFIDGFGTGSVEDRGGAIVSIETESGTIDRLDLWMGYGEEGLKRALYWGKKVVYGQIVDSKSDVTIDLSKFPTPNRVVKVLKENEQKNLSYNSGILTSNVGPESNPSKIKEVQKILKEMGLFNYEINGVFDDKLKEVIIKYQFDKKLIDSRNNLGAGYLGPKTRNALINDYLKLQKNKSEEIKLANQEKEKIKQLTIKEKTKNIENVISKKIEELIANIGNPVDGDVSKSVRILQKTMKSLGYFDDKDTGVFGEKTKKAIINYQIDKGIIKDENEKNAGILDNKTLAEIKQDLKTKLKLELIKQNKLIGLNI